MTIALCLLTWNELKGCENDVPQIDRDAFDQIFCIDGGSTDGTVEYLQQNHIGVYKQSSPGLNQATKDAIHHCKCDACVFFHPKGTVPVSDTLKFRYFFEQGYDLVVASRMMKDSINEEDNRLFRPRKWFVIGLAILAGILFKKEGNMVWDVLHGFRGIKTEQFRALAISDYNPSVDIETVCRSYKKRLNRIEFPTREKERIGGETHFKAFSTGKRLLCYMIREIGRKD